MVHTIPLLSLYTQFTECGASIGVVKGNPSRGQLALSRNNNFPGFPNPEAKEKFFSGHKIKSVKQKEYLGEKIFP